MTKEQWQQIGTHAASILATALAAAGIAFLQSLLTQHGIECGQAINPQSTAALGGGMQTVVSMIKLTNTRSV